MPSECCFKGAKCHACVEVGHISTACRSRNKSKQPNRKQHPNPKNTKYLSEERGKSTEAKHVESPYSMFTFKNKRTASYKVTVSVNDTSLEMEMEIDTGAALSVISEDTYKHLCSQSKLLPSPLRSGTSNIHKRGSEMQGNP